MRSERISTRTRMTVERGLQEREIESGSREERVCLECHDLVYCEKIEGYEGTETAKQ